MGSGSSLWRERSENSFYRVQSGLHADDAPGKNDEICQYHLRGRCSWGSECLNVHSELPYQWRWMEPYGTWKNFGENENDDIERAFCHPKNEEHTNYRRGTTIYFKTMSAKYSMGGRFKVERLSTPSSINHENQTWRTNWLWYWKNPKDIWIKFGDLDDYEGNRAEIKSKELEQAFVSDPTGVAKFRTTGTQPFDYIVEFRKMIQRNVTCKTTRKLCRRPDFINKLDFELNHLRLVKHAYNTEIKEIKAPENWSIPEWKDLSEHILIVQLKTSDSEYGEIKSLFLQSLQNAHIKSIDRIENGDLWENYMMKKSKMMKKKRKIREKRVFHGTKNKYIAAICKQGFDFRLNGQTTATMYGKGCYFARDSCYSNNYAENGADKSMFVAKILPGEYACGDPDYCRPPHKVKSDQSSDLYDSCVDDVRHPTIFVIFDNNQIYPEFLVRYTTK